MPLDRNTVARAVGEHVRQLRQGGARLTQDDKQTLRRLHERVAERVARHARKR